MIRQRTPRSLAKGGEKAATPALGEFDLIDRFFRRPTRHSVLGIGDDAALLAPTVGSELVVSVDMLVAGRHFFAEVDPEALGYKTLAVNLSDIAAMGAAPRWALLAGALPEADSTWLTGFARGFFALAEAHDVDLVGGDTTRGPLNLCVTILGEVPAGEALRRSGAQLGDGIYVSGNLGDAALALAHHRGKLKLERDEFVRCQESLLRPTPRIALGQVLRGVATAAIDLSDGLVGDLGHILDASGAGAAIELKAIPRSTALDRRLAGTEHTLALECLLAGGDDYELCFTAPEDRAADVQALAEELELPLARIGMIEQRAGLAVLDDNGVALSSLPHSFDHFAR